MSGDFTVDLGDLNFILAQIKIAERNAAGESLAGIMGPQGQLIPYGLRTVDGTYNNLLPGNAVYGAADQLLPRLTTPVFRNLNDGGTFTPGPGAPTLTNTDYGTPGSVVDADPRLISNLIVDMTNSNPAAIAAWYVNAHAQSAYADAHDGNPPPNGYTLAAALENLSLAGGGAINGTGNAGANILTGNDAANVLSGLGGNDTLVGGGGNDTLDGGAGADAMSGGLGNDSYVVDTIGDVVDEIGGDGIDIVSSSVTFTLADGVDNLTLTGTTAINGTGNADRNTLTGNAGANILSGLAGDDILSGLGGNDRLIGGDGADSLDGGTGVDVMLGGLGDDTYAVDNAGDVVDETGGDGVDLVRSSVTFTLGANVENLTLLTGATSGTGNAAANVVTGNASANTLTGLAGNDTLIGLGGNDRLVGGEGADLLDGGTGTDTMLGGLGDDTYVVNTTADVVDETGGDGVDTVNSSVNLALAAGLERLTLTGTAAINGRGNAAANILTGNAAANSLFGMDGDDQLIAGAGADTLDGGTGADVMAGGLGNDTYLVDNVGDVVDETGGDGVDTVNSSVTFTLGAGVERLTLTGVAAVDATGNADANILTGNAAANTLSGLDGSDMLRGADGADHLLGGAGDDTLDGGAGVDVMSGGLGNDLYIVNTAADVVDEAGGDGVDSVSSSVTFTLGTDVENLTLTGTLAINGSPPKRVWS